MQHYYHYYYYQIILYIRSAQRIFDSLGRRLVIVLDKAVFDHETTLMWPRNQTSLAVLGSFVPEATGPIRSPLYNLTLGVNVPK